MGYDPDQIVGIVDDDLICGICFLVLKDPVMTKCGHLFCSSCINRWVEDKWRSNCPLDRRPLAKRDLIPAPLKTCARLNSLQIRCDFATYGCPITLPVTQSTSHASQCIFNPKPVECEKGCGLTATRYQLRYHDCMCYISVLFREHQRELTKLRNDHEAMMDQLNSRLSTLERDKMEDEMWN